MCRRFGLVPSAPDRLGCNPPRTGHGPPRAASAQGSPLRTTLEALEGLYTKAERWDDLVALYERQIGASPSTERKASLHHALGSVFEKRLADHERAFGEFEAALKLEAQHAATVASLEGLMATPEHAARSAEMLESVYLARLDWRSVMGTLEARLGVSQDPDERRTLLRRQCSACPLATAPARPRRAVRVAAPRP